MDRAIGAVLLGLPVLLAGGAVQAQSQPEPHQGCRFLLPIGGSGGPVVEKRISPDGLIRRTNWNTDFAVDRAFTSYRITLQSASSDPGVFPTAAFLRFTDNSDLRLVNENLNLQPREERQFGPFPAVPGKRTSQVNVRVGSSAMPGSTGFSYRVSVQGCGA
ncbi:hypothetical protein [Cyanobium sp. NIES-981]|uniref:hypothetical protein n=1 Tax=Cyanobium sp. NIES-981 TaxID=1851505 RepID=UPI0007DCCC78|nr:hypothetical protein [Cyanobium sp. NIES-981]SBO42715.1 conserved exported protein of unknown function [Cyanobium sp. NIES-981]